MKRSSALKYAQLAGAILALLGLAYLLVMQIGRAHV